MKRSDVYRAYGELISAYALAPEHAGDALFHVTISELADWAVVWSEKSPERDDAAERAACGEASGWVERSGEKGAVE